MANKWVLQGANVVGGGSGVNEATLSCFLNTKYKERLDHNRILLWESGNCPGTSIEYLGKGSATWQDLGLLSEFLIEKSFFMSTCFCICNNKPDLKAASRPFLMQLHR